MTQRRALFVIGICILTTLVAPASVAASPDGTEDTAFVEGEFTNTVPVKQSDDSAYLWETESNTLEVTFNASNESNLYKLCVQAEDGEQIGCQDKSAAEGTQNVTFEYENLSTFEKSENVTVVLWNNYPGQSEKLGTDTVNVSIIEKEGDIDSDELSNVNELSNNTSMFLMDTDKDSLEDGAEVKNYGTSPTDADTDGDNLGDAMELSNSLSPTDADTDGDGIPDGVENRLGTPPKDPTADTDNDGLSDAYEYAHDSNPVVADTDGDGLRDGLETKLGTKVDDARTTPLLLFAGGTLLGVVAVGTRWVRVSETYPFSGSLNRVMRNREAGGDNAAVESEPEPETRPDTRQSSQRPEVSETQQPSKPILTDEDRVVQLLRENDGWVYQSTIVESNNWSKSKVSRLLSRMCDDGTIEKISVGRQNIVAEKGSMPEGVASPLEE
ncbi:MarR family transcriptional regulator (plasmid) [Haloferax larsenii]|uniref:MarR family transcriptional regulator n=1 Tax=Haloferax larsenii TaxID=302484 RepID=A0ABY5RKN6_HALLR|nr:MarR family transcriptional regulator [Haloferax larsenii]UVE52095.1 MarR family transcriptional regulator [Haloferax larsenii]